MAFQEELQKREGESKLETMYNEAVEITRDETRKVFEWFQRYFSQVSMVVFSFFFIGIQQFAEAGFDPWFFVRARFWYEYLPFVTAQWLILFAVVTGNIRWLSDVDKDYKKHKQSIQNHVDEDKKTPYIYDGAKLVDRERKMRAFKTKIARKLEKIIKRRRLGTFANMEAFLGGDDTCLRVRGKNRLRLKLGVLCGMLNGEYIEKNIDNIKVRYTQVTESGLVSGFKPRGNETYESDFQDHTTTTIVNEFGFGQLTMMFVGFVILALDLSAKSASVTTWIFFSFKVFVLSWTYFKGSFRSKVVFERTHLKALQERDSMLDKIKRRILGG